MIGNKALSIVVSYTSVVLAIWTFTHGILKDRRSKDVRSLLEHLGRAAAAGAIPSALTLLVGAFIPSILATIPGLNLPIALGGLSLLYVCLQTLVPPSQ